MVIISHRGESKYSIENTMKAFYLAEISDSQGIEVDVRKTKDNKLVLFHDKSLKRIYKISDNISNYNYEDLLKLNSEKIVLLEEFLKFFSNKNLILEIEVKEKNIENQIYNLLKKYNTKNFIIISFDFNILKKFKEIDKNIKLGYLVYNLSNNVLEKIIKINAYQVICYHCFISEDDIIECNSNSILIYAWGTNDINEIRRLNNLGINGVIVDSYKDVSKSIK